MGSLLKKKKDRIYEKGKANPSIKELSRTKKKKRRRAQNAVTSGFLGRK